MAKKRPISIGRLLKWVESRRPAARPGARGGSVFAWWNLSRKQKQLLQQQRFAGRFGGTPGQARYFWVQEGSTERGARGAAKAGITPTHFVQNALDRTEDTVADIITRALEHAG